MAPDLVTQVANASTRALRAPITASGRSWGWDMAITSTSFTKTPQAGDDCYYWNENDLLSSGLYNTSTRVLTLDVMSNDLGGKAKVLYSIDDGNGNAIPYELLSQDAVNGVSAWEATAGGNQARINNGKIELDVSHDLPGGIDSLAAGKEFTD